MYDTQQMVIVLSVNLDKHIIFTSSEMTLYYFRNGFQSSRYRIKGFRIFQIYTNISTSFISYLLRIDHIFRSFQYSQISQLLNALVDSRPGNVTRSCYFQKGIRAFPAINFRICSSKASN